MSYVYDFSECPQKAWGRKTKIPFSHTDYKTQLDQDGLPKSTQLVRAELA